MNRHMILRASMMHLKCVVILQEKLVTRGLLLFSNGCQGNNEAEMSVFPSYLIRWVTREGRRSSSASAYLSLERRAILNNLEIRVGCRVIKIHIEEIQGEKRAVAVTYIAPDGTEVIESAAEEIIISAGGIETPKVKKHNRDFDFLEFFAASFAVRNRD